MGQAVKWWSKAADQGHAWAQAMLGVCYERGEGVEKDLVQAAEWYRKAAEQGLAVAQNNLGWSYAHGEGVAKDLVQAAEWYRKAAAQGLAVAQNNLKGIESAEPFELTPSITTTRQAKEKYKLSNAGTNEWTQGKMYTVQPVSQIAFNGLKNVLLIFDQKEVLQGVIATFNKENFSSLLDGLEKKYKLENKKIPRVGNKKANFTSGNSSIELESPHLSFNATLTFLTSDMSKLFQQKSQAQALEKKDKENAML